MQMDSFSHRHSYFLLWNLPDLGDRVRNRMFLVAGINTGKNS